MEVMLDQRSLRSLTKVLKLFTLLRQARYELRLDLLDCVVHNGLCVAPVWPQSASYHKKGCWRPWLFCIPGIQLADNLWTAAGNGEAPVALFKPLDLIDISASS